MDFGGQPNQSINSKTKKELNRVELVNDGGNRLIGVGKDNLSIHMLRPYLDLSKFEIGGWEEFDKRIKNALEAYKKLSEREQINRVSVRYINKIVIPAEFVRLEEYLKCTLLQIEGLPQNYSDFFNSSEYNYDENHSLILTYASLPSSTSNQKECLLDLDVIWHHDTNPIDKNGILKIITNLHHYAGIAFESVVTDKARELFNAC
ncbi:MAG: TIGR04255 family protein [Rhodobacteraceae bacterium]|nr:TIGR04255 family protein [Paracoccaceae bacterium]